ncbi:MAG: hypothetical protein F6K26_26730 [Moorea sp. SIO2I5]|nr:hypothetical protein [Moorena sp. SIO2I5]
MQRMVVGRFRNRSDAEGHMQALKRLMPDAEFIIIFDIGQDLTSPPAKARGILKGCYAGG